MNESPAIRAVLFDMDGVLVDVSGSYRRAIEETVYYFTGREIEPSTVQRYKNFGGFNDDWQLTHAIIGDSGMEVSLPRVIGEFQRRYRGDDWNGFITEERPIFMTHTLDELQRRGHVLGIVTGRPEVEARWTLDRLGWRHCFPLLVAREQQDNRFKPDPFPLQHALGVLGAAGMPVKPQCAVYVGDSVDDMVAARAAGQWAVGLVPPYLEYDSHAPLLRSRGAHAVVRKPDQLPDLLTHLTESAGLASTA